MNKDISYKIILKGKKMELKKLLIKSITVFSITLIVTIGVTYIWGLIFNDTASIDWETSFRLAIIFGIVFPIIEERNKKNEKRC